MCVCFLPSETPLKSHTSSPLNSMKMRFCVWKAFACRKNKAAFAARHGGIINALDKFDLLPLFTKFHLHHVLREILRPSGRTTGVLHGSFGVMPNEVHSLTKSPSHLPAIACTAAQQSPTLLPSVCLRSCQSIACDSSLAGGSAPQLNNVPSGRH